MLLTTLGGQGSVTAPADVVDDAAIGDLIAHAFDHDPVTRWLVPDPARHHVIAGLFTLATTDALTTGTIDVLSDDAGDTIGAAIWFDHTRSDPDPPGPTRDETPTRGKAPSSGPGSDSDAGWRAPFDPDPHRWDTLDDLITRHHLDGPHHYLFAIGVHPTLQGRGLGSHLLAHGHRRQGRFPAYLEATSPASRRLYQRHGYTDLGQIQPPDGPPLWRMWRPPASSQHRDRADQIAQPSLPVSLDPHTRNGREHR